MNRNEVIHLLSAHKHDLHKKFGVKSLALFGSLAREEGRPDSDVDLLVEFDRPTGLFGLFSLQDHLEYLLGCPVDLGTPGGLKPRVREHVLAERVNVF